MKLSVIIPVYNAEPFLKRCLNSLQPIEGVEYIIVDDGSTDKSLELCQAKAKSLAKLNFNAFHVIHFRFNYGVSFARNAGISEAEGDYITFLDADDELAPDGVKAMLEKLYVWNAAEIVQFNHYRVREDGMAYLIPKYMARQGFYKLDNLPPKWAPVWNKCYKREFLDLHNIRFPHGQQFDEDRQFNLACLKITGGLQCLEAVGIIKHFDNNESLCHTFNRKKAAGCIKALAELMEDENAAEFDQLIFKSLTMHLNSEKFKRLYGG